MIARDYVFSFASAATTSNKQYVGPHARVMMVVSATTAWNAGVGNASITVRAGLSETDTHADLASMSISTQTAKSAFNLPYAGTPWMSLGLGTACTGSTAANGIDVIVFEDI